MTPLEACTIAADLVKRAGFELCWSSRSSEARYYIAPGRFGTLRIAMHAKGGKSLRGQDGPTIVSITFPEANSRGFTRTAVENHTANAIGLYLIRAESLP